MIDINEQLSRKNSVELSELFFVGQNWRLYVWELDITWLSITVVDVVNITNKHMFFIIFYYVHLASRTHDNHSQLNRM